PVGPDDPRVKALKRQFVMKSLDVVEKELLQVQAERRRIQVERAIMEDELEEVKRGRIEEKIVEERLREDAFVEKLLGRIAKVKEAMEEIHRVLGPKAEMNAYLARLEEELCRSQADLESRISELRPKAKELLHKEAIKRQEDKLLKLQKRLNSLKKIEAALTEEADRLRIEAVQLEEDAKKDAKPKAKENDS
ncbi:MAG: hypothetical protein L0312_27545, partial [Acidobacteria bacterium]|nr:hypothetical protein [Acidobacteriota bacterium]